MKNQYEFFYNKEKTKKKLIKNILIFLASSIFLVIIFLNLQSVTFTIISLSFVPVILLYVVLKTWLQYNYTKPLILIDQKQLIFSKMNLLLNFTETILNIDEIKTIGTDVKMKGERVISESLSLKMINSEKFNFQIDVFDLTHNDLFRIIKELNPEAKLLNIGEFVYE